MRGLSVGMLAVWLVDLLRINKWLHFVHKQVFYGLLISAFCKLNYFDLALCPYYRSSFITILAKHLRWN